MIVFLAAIAVGFAVVFLVGQRPASAHDHLISKTVLVEGEERLQAGRLVKESSRTYADGEGGLNTDTAYYYYWRFPDVNRVAAGAEMRIRVFVDRQPEAFVLAAYPRVTKRAGPTGRSGC